MTISMDKPKCSHFQLRRVGKEATKKCVGNIFNLNRNVTKFGRHSGNDYFIDSSELDCFISRWHSEVHKLVDKGETHYVIKDKSLNGTYVNNHRILGNHILQPGEVVCFGHTNGKNLKPGDYAPQTDSEFEFIFEEVADSDEVEITGVEQNGSVSKSCSDVLGYTLPHQSPDGSIPDQKILPQDRISPVLQDISNKSSSPAGLVPFEQITPQSRPSGSCNITVQVSQDRVFPPTTQPHLSPAEHVILHPSAQTVGFHPNHSKQQTSRTHTDLSSTSSPPALISLNQSTLSHVSTALPAGPLSASSAPSPVPDPVTSAFIPPASVPQGPPSHGQVTKAKRKRTNSESKPSARTKSKEGPDIQKKPRSVSTSEEEDEDSWHYDGDKCDAFDCKKPTGAKVSWVQCDDCDGWYHTQCAHCKYGKVKRKNTEFHCGCV